MDHLIPIQICRLCLSTDSIFNSVQSSDNLFMDIFNLIQIQIFDIPGYDTVICEMCKSRIEMFTVFKNTCITSNDRLTNKYEKFKDEVATEDIKPYELWCQNTEDYEQKPMIEEQDTLWEAVDVSVQPMNKVGKQSQKKTKTEREVCSYCGKMFLFLSQHIKSMHSGTLSNTKKFSCGLCFERFTERSIFKQHVNNIHDGKMFRCDICGKRDKNLGSLARHIRSHSKIRPYSCELCGQLFRYSKQLFEHKLRHDNNRRFTCDVCNKKFFTHTEISSHKLIHNTERTFKCKICDKGFKRPDHVRSHMRIHLKDKSFACRICTKIFSYKHNMVVHLKNIHGTMEYNNKK